MTPEPPPPGDPSEVSVSTVTSSNTTVLTFLGQIMGLCRKFDASVTSWIRTPSRNRFVGGHPQSQHLTGTAVDLVLDDTRKTDQLIHAAQRLGMTPINEGDHIHIQLFTRRQR